MIKIENLQVTVGEFKIKIDRLEMMDQDYLIIVGPTGAGKTILLETIAGFHKVHKGRIILKNRDVTHLPPNQRNISMVYQDYMLFPHMTVKDNIGYPLKIHKIRDEKRIYELAKKLEITHLLNRYPNTLSGGEMQRVAIARAVITNPDLLLLDEPFNALDPKMRNSARELIRDFIAEMGIGTIHVTHDFSDAWILGNKLAVMREGKIVRFGTVDEVFSNPKDEFVAGFLGSTNILRGKVEGYSNNLTIINISNKKIFSVDKINPGKEVLISIRPENIVLSKKPLEGSQRNKLYLKISHMKREGHIVWITLTDDNFSIKAMLTPNAVESIQLKENDRVYASFKATATKIVRII